MILTGLTVLVLCLSAAACAEDMPTHTDAHTTVERARGSASYRMTDSAESHVAVTVYDLYCEDCHRVVRENVRTEEKEEPHEWSVTRREATCLEEGEETRLCGRCGMAEHKVFPIAAHQYVSASQLEGYGVGAVRGSGKYADRTVGRVIAAPTCTEKGRGVLVCVVCGGAEESVSIPPIDHDWSAWEELKLPDEQVCEAEVQETRKCRGCGTEEKRVVSPAPGHQWKEENVREPACQEPGMRELVCAVCHKTKTEEIPALDHIFADAGMLIKQEAGATVMGSGEYAGKVIGRVGKPSSCTDTGVGVLVCLRCQDAEVAVIIPRGDHRWSDWEPAEVPQEEICVTDVTGTRRCLDCGEEETEVLTPAPGHKWAAIRFEEPTCTMAGKAVRQCVVCKKEEVIEALPLGHCFMWVDKSTPSPTVNGVREYVCTVCGYVADTQSISYAQMYYNNTITSFGPMTRELIGGNVWNRVTPIDLSQDGMFTYPLIASNLYAVGTATILVEKEVVTVSYRLNSKQIKVHNEALLLYPNLESLRTGQDAVQVAFDTPFDAASAFGQDNCVIMAITLRADYDARGAGIQDFRPDVELIEKMTGLVD